MPKQVSFSEAQGLIPLPGPFKLGELPNTTRRKIHAVIYRSLRNCFEGNYSGTWMSQPWKTITEDIHVEILGQPILSYSDSHERWGSVVNAMIFSTKFNEVFDFLLFVLRHPNCPKGLASVIGKIFEDDVIAYRLTAAPIEIIPISTPQEGEIVMKAIEDASIPSFSGSRVHLISAGKCINGNKFEDSICHSIHAVESVARILDGGNKDLGSALTALEKKVSLHGGFKKGVLALYGYTSDEQGIRHALLDDKIKPDLTDAMFMFGACSALVSFLINKARSVGLITEEGINK